MTMPTSSGKSTYCHGMQQFLAALGRKCIVINVDPANDSPPYECQIDVRELVAIDRVMDELALGPNGGLVYAVAYLLQNIDWLKDKLDQYPGTMSMHWHLLSRKHRHSY
jgi:GPN-loop GTPase